MAKRLGAIVFFFLVIGGILYLVHKGNEESQERGLPIEEPALERVRQYRDELLGAEGSASYNKEALEKVIQRYEDYIEEHPNSARAYYDLGYVLQDYAARPHEAAKKWEKAVEIAPDFAEAHNSLAIYYDHSGQTIRGIEEVKKAIQYDPDRGVYHLNLATFYFASRSEVKKEYGWDLPEIYEACLKEYKKAIQLEPASFDFASDYARTYFFAKHFQVETDYDAAIAAWQYCLGLEIDDYQRALTLLHLANLCEECGRLDEARKHAEAILKIRPNHPAAKRFLERLKASQKNVP